LIHKNNPVNLHEYNVVYCDSLQALEWAYRNGLPESAIIKSSSPAMLWDRKKNIHNIEARWTVSELEKFQNTVQKLTEVVFDRVSSIDNVSREMSLVVSRSVYQFQKIIYKAACLDKDDLVYPRLLIYVDGKTGPAGNIMNSPWDRLLISNPLFTKINYTLENDKWEVLHTRGVSYWERFKVAGYEAIIYRMAIRLMKVLPNWVFSKELLIPNENELNIEIASYLASSGVKISELKLESENRNSNNVTSYENIDLIYQEILPVIQERIEGWVPAPFVATTIILFKSYLEEQTQLFKDLTDKWEYVFTKKNKRKQVVLANCPGNIKGQALSYVCNKNKIPLLSSQHGVTIEISKRHNMLNIAFDNNAADAMFSYNHKIVDIERNTHFNKSKFYIVGMPMRLIRMKHSQISNGSSSAIIYISTNLYHMGFNLSQKTDYGNAIDEQDLIVKVLGRLPHKVCYKTYPENNRRYADIDPVLKSIETFENIELYSIKVDMRYLISKYRVLVTSQATSTLGWPIMSGKPVVFINKKYDSPLTDGAYKKLSQGIFVFNDDNKNFHKDLKSFLSQSINVIESLWKEKEKYREEMIKDYFSAYKSGAGKRSAQIILKEYLS
jgi:hypothetical protein